MSKSVEDYEDKLEYTEPEEVGNAFADTPTSPILTFIFGTACIFL